MGAFKRILIATVIALSAYVIYKCKNHCEIPALPKLDENEWWGPGKPVQLGSAILPFKIEVKNEVILDLNNRLDKYLQKVQTPPLENQGFQYGFNTDYLKEVITYWRKNYVWHDRQKYLNSYPHYKTHVNGLHLHFVRAPPRNPEGKKVLPLLLVHGWPGSVREFLDIIPFLTTPREDADFVFEVIAPSLPGYGFSQGAAKTGMGTAQMAVVLNNLMQRLGFRKYYVQGGDWGSVITKNMAILYPENVLGAHSNFCLIRSSLHSNLKWLLGSFYPPLIVEEKFQHRLYPISKVLIDLLEETGYYHIQATKPDTVGTALSDTPVGLAAYILEKFSTWTNTSNKSLRDGGLTKKFSLDALLDNVMIYWVTNSITTSQRLYAENFNPVTGVIEKIPVRVPTACARFENELLWQPEAILRDKYINLLQVSDIEGAGHFAAFEEPRKLSDDIWSAVKKFIEYNKAHGKSIK